MKHPHKAGAILAGLAGTLLLVVAFWATGCGDADHSGQDHGQSPEVAPEVATAYYCPMHCEGDKTYDEAGTCPVCAMNLVVVDADYDPHRGHDHEPDNGAAAHD